MGGDTAGETAAGRGGAAGGTNGGADGPTPEGADAGLDLWGAGVDGWNGGNPVAGDGGVAVAVVAGRTPDSGCERAGPGTSVRIGGAVACDAAAGGAGGVERGTLAAAGVGRAD